MRKISLKFCFRSPNVLVDSINDNSDFLQNL